MYVLKKFIEEFKAFALRGNVMDMAVGGIIGGAFSGIVTSLTDNFITPIISLVGGTRYSWEQINGFVSSFVGTVVNFLIMAFILFCLLKAVNKLMARGNQPEAHAAPTTQKCPYCCSEIPIEAVKCAHCASELPKTE